RFFTGDKKQENVTRIVAAYAISSFVKFCHDPHFTRFLEKTNPWLVADHFFRYREYRHALGLVCYRFNLPYNWLHPQSGVLHLGHTISFVEQQRSLRLIHGRSPNYVGGWPMVSLIAVETKEA